MSKDDYSCVICDHSLIKTKELARGAEFGCEGCRILRDGVAHFTGDICSVSTLQLVVDMSLFVFLSDYRGDNLRVLEFFSIPGAQEHRVSQVHANKPGRPLPLRKIGPARHVSENSSSDDCVALAEAWLSNCLSAHSACRGNGTHTLPTRVIEVGTCDDETKLYINQSGKRAEYAALSHCWGSGKPITLTKATLKEKQRQIVFDSASKTFKEAVDLTRRLGIPYLWIDSLCIVQDKGDPDWELEAPKMSDVYNNATVTISAAASADASGGLFPNPTERAKDNEVLKLTVKGSHEFVYVRTRHQNPLSVEDTVHSSIEPEQPHLRSRGWVLQEDHLSPRMLHFRKEELSWTCSTHTRCECRVRPSLPLLRPYRVAAGTRDKSKELTRSFHLPWPAIVMEFTRRHLTIQSDRVAAMCGLARHIESLTKDLYSCGLWYEDMAFQLLWRVDRRAGSEPAPFRFQFPYAPTYSWMSVPDHISYYERVPIGSAPHHPSMHSKDAIRPLLKVVNISRFPVDWKNPVGRVFMCPLILLAYLVPVAFDPATSKWILTGRRIEDFDPRGLRVVIDVAEDLPERNPNAQYVMILAGEWIAQGMRVLCMQSICLLAKGLAEDKMGDFILGYARKFQRRLIDMHGSEESLDAATPDKGNSFKRVGFARGAGSLEAWEKAKVEDQFIFLF